LGSIRSAAVIDGGNLTESGDLTESGASTLGGKWMQPLVVAPLVVALALALATQLAPARASAQCVAGTPTCARVSPTAKGMIGLGLIGAELGFVIPALVQEAAGTNEWWPYLVFPVIGAAGGVVGGYFMEQETQNSAEVDVAFLAVGLALVVPALVTTLALTAYDPGEAQAHEAGDEDSAPPVLEDGTTTEAVQVEAVESEESGDETAPTEAPAAPADTDTTGGSGSEGGATDASPGGTTSIQRRIGALLAGGPGLLRFDGHGNRVLLGIPMIRRIATFTASETDALHLAPASDVNIPVISATF
jgi:hypothetical protein